MSTTQRDKLPGLLFSLRRRLNRTNEGETGRESERMRDRKRVDWFDNKS